MKAFSICVKFQIQDPIFARIICENMRRTIRALFALFFPLFMQFYTIGAVTHQKAHFVKKSPFDEILRYPEFFCKHSKTQEVMPIQSYLRQKSINQELGFAITLEPLVRFARNFGFRTRFLQGLCAKICAERSERFSPLFSHFLCNFILSAR